MAAMVVRAHDEAAPAIVHGAADAPCDPAESAEAAGLYYVNDDSPGITRRRAGKGFTYRAPDGSTVRDLRTLARIKALAIPPAWTDVWICPSPDGHIQATGRDAKGRKQYRYHDRWREVRDATKYDRMIAFGESLPAIRERVDQDLARPGVPREKVLAAVVRLLETTHIRVGNHEYARQNGSFGLTTMRDRHVKVDGSEVRFRFTGKSGKEHRITLRDRRLATIVKRCRDLPGQQLFQYVDDDGVRQTIQSSDVNAYLREITGQDFTAKDFRTWAGTVLTLRELAQRPSVDSQREAEQQLVAVIKAVAQELGNTPAVCRRCYVHPAVIDAYLARDPAVDPGLASGGDEPEQPHALQPDEAAVLRLLRERRADTGGTP